MKARRHALDRPLDAAAAASQAGRWEDAIGLWRDQLRIGGLHFISMACIAEAAFMTGRQGLVDQMLAQFEDDPQFLPKLRDRDIKDAIDLSDAQLAEQFAAKHPLGCRMPQRHAGEALPIARTARSRILQGPRAAQLTRRIEQLQASGGGEAVHDFIALQLRHSARLYRSRECVYRAILGLWKAGYDGGDPVMREALARWDALGRGGAKAVLEEARLQRALKFYAYARKLLRGALEEGGGDELRLRRRLAALVHERHRWADDAELLTAEDFDPGTPREAFVAMRDEFGEGGAPGDPLENAFAWLFGDPSRIAESYDPANRLLMVGNTLACGGMERMMAATYRHFADSGRFDAVDMALLGFEKGTESAHYADLAGVIREDIVLLDQGGEAAMPFALLPGSWKERCRKLQDHIVATRPRVVHAWNDLTGLLAAYAGLIAGCPKIIVHFHHGPSQPLGNLAEQVASYPAVYRMLLQRPEVEFVFCADAAAGDYADWWRVPHSERFRRIYNGFDLPPPPADRAQAKAALGLPPDATIVGTVGRLGSVKQPLHWAEAAIALAARRDDLHFVWAGEGLLRERLAEEFKEAGLADRLQLPGQVDNVSEWLGAFDLFWQTSASEGLPNALIEAQFAGVPVIAFDVGGVRETIIDGETGMLVPPGDIDELVRETEQRLDDQEWLASARKGARIKARKRFSADQFHRELGALYAGGESAGN